MIANIASSLASRLLVMLLTLAVVIMNTNILGDEGQGTAALIQLGILLLVSITNFIAGGAVVYLTPRISPRSLVLPAYLWSCCVAIVFYPLLRWSAMVPDEFVLDVCVLGLMQALFTFHLQISMGKERIKRFNLIVGIQAFVLAGALAILFFMENRQSINAFVLALYLSFGITLFMSVAASLRYLRAPSDLAFKAALRELWDYGRYAQAGNILQLLNYRSNLYLLERLLVSGRGAVGIFSIGLYAGEAVWSIGKSLSLVQYARISNSTDPEYNKRLTIRFTYLSGLSASFLTLLMLLIPEQVYLMVFGEDMRGLYTVLFWVSPGIVANSVSMIIAHHFSGTGRHSRNTISSAIGLITMLTAGIPLILQIGLSGAAIAASVGYLAQLITLGFCFVREEQIKLVDLRIERQEVRALIASLRRRSD